MAREPSQMDIAMPKEPDQMAYLGAKGVIKGVYLKRTLDIQKRYI